MTTDFYYHVNEFRKNPTLEVGERYIQRLLQEITKVTPNTLNRLIKDLDRNWKSFVKRVGSFEYQGEKFDFSENMFRQALAQLPDVEGSPHALEMFKLMFQEFRWDWESNYNPQSTSQDLVIQITIKEV